MKNRLVDCLGHETDAMEELKKLAGGNFRVYEYTEKPSLLDAFFNSLILESSDGLVRKMKSAVAEETAPRAEYRAR